MCEPRKDLPLQLLSTERLFYNRRNGKLSHSLIEVYDGNTLDEEGLKWYLRLGYIPGRKTLFKDVEVIHNRPNTKIVDSKLVEGQKYYIEDYINFDQHIGKSKEYLIEEGGKVFNKAIENLYLQSKKKIILPVTAGLDSRLILGGLLKVTTAENIIAYTWGTPGTMDFELAKKMCKSLGIKHVSFDVTKYELTLDRLEKYAISSDFSIPIFDHWPMDWIQELVENEDGEVWIGLLGGSLSGANLPKSENENVIEHYLKKNSRIRSANLAETLLNSNPLLEYLNNSSDFKDINHDTLEIYYRNPDLLFPTMAHSKLEYIIPFSNPEVLSFFLSLPFEYRINRQLMQDMIVTNYPNLAKFPSNRNSGMGLHIKGFRKKLSKRFKHLSPTQSPKPGGKYMSLKQIIESDKKLNGMVKSKLENLRKREMFIDEGFTNLTQEFYSSNDTHVDHSRAIDALVSLEMFLEFVNYK